MKNKGLIIFTIIFFLIVNTSYYWQVKLGLLAFPAFLIIVIAFLGLSIVLLVQLFSAIKENFKDKNRMLIIGLLAIVLILTFLKPTGIINFEKLEGKDVLVAQIEGAANCMTTLKLKEHHNFTEKSVCFGIKEIKGNYRLQNDTIYFENVELDGEEDEFYKFAVIKPSKILKDKNFYLVQYKSKNDTIGRELFITKNDLTKLN